MCNVTCKGCNRTTGICDIGCKPGWRDIYCHKGIFFNIHVKLKLTRNCLNRRILFILIMISKSFKLVHISFSKATYVFIICYILCHKIQYFTIECSAGSYGVNCASTCGQCLNEKVCNHETGSCDEGCQTGYKGPTCKTGIQCERFLSKNNASKIMCYLFMVSSAATCVLDIDRHWRLQYPITMLLSYMFSRQKSFLFIFYI